MDKPKYDHSQKGAERSENMFPDVTVRRPFGERYGRRKGLEVWYQSGSTKLVTQ